MVVATVLVEEELNLRIGALLCDVMSSLAPPLPSHRTGHHQSPPPSESSSHGRPGIVAVVLIWWSPRYVIAANFPSPFAQKTFDMCVS
jgi:hypothetical protein